MHVPLLLGETEANILSAFARYHYLLAEQVCRLFFSRGSLTHVKSLLKRLADQGLLEPTKWPGSLGNRPFVYTLTHQGRRVVGELGLSQSSRFRHGEKTTVGAIFLDHVLCGNDFLISAELLTRRVPAVTLLELCHELDLKRRPVSIQTTQGKAAVIHDGFVDLAVSLADGVYRTPIALEIDRGTIRDQKRWRERISHLLAYLQGPFQQAFGAKTLTIAVVATPGRGRRDQLKAWTEAQLRAEKREQDSAVFCFTDLDPKLVTPEALFCDPVWAVPNATESCCLLEGVNPPG